MNKRKILLLVAIPCFLFVESSIYAEKDSLTQIVGFFMKKADDYIGFSAQERVRNQQIIASLKKIAEETGRSGWKISDPLSYSQKMIFISSNEGERFGINFIDMSKNRKIYPDYDVGKDWDSFLDKCGYEVAKNKLERKILEKSTNHILFYYYPTEYFINKNFRYMSRVVLIEVSGHMLIQKNYSIDYTILSDSDINWWASHLKQIPIKW